MKNPIVFALDYPSLNAARKTCYQVAPHIGMFKIGLELFIAEGMTMISFIHSLGRPVFLDLKLFDIPETVARAVAAAEKHKISFLTVHAAGGQPMMKAAVGALKGDTLKIAAVTKLTSQDASYSEVLDAAIDAYSSGIKTFVCSANEAKQLRKDFADDELIIITPGIRMGSETHDQKRFATPRNAIDVGADWLVMGREIRDAENPEGFLKNVLASLEEKE